MSKIDALVWEMWRDLLQEVPEAEQAVRDYVIAGRRRIMAEAGARAEARSREVDARVQARIDAAVDELLASVERQEGTHH